MYLCLLLGIRRSLKVFPHIVQIAVKPSGYIKIRPVIDTDFLNGILVNAANWLFTPFCKKRHKKSTKAVTPIRI